jgi:hypothetical protein
VYLQCGDITSRYSIKVREHELRCAAAAAAAYSLLLFASWLLYGHHPSTLNPTAATLRI